MKYCFILKNNKSKPLLHLLVLSRTNQTMIKKVLLEIFFAKVDIWDHKFIRTTMYLITCFFITFPQSSHLIQKLNQIKHFPLIFFISTECNKERNQDFFGLNFTTPPLFCSPYTGQNNFASICHKLTMAYEVVCDPQKWCAKILKVIIRLLMNMTLIYTENWDTEVTITIATQTKLTISVVCCYV